MIEARPRVLARVLGAWPRVLELGLGAWLLVAARALGHAGRPELVMADRIAGAATLIIVLVSLVPKLRVVRVATLPIALALGAWAWTALPRPRPAGAQNQLLVALVLALLAFVPTAPDQPPSSWRPYVQRTTW
jgi:hypothetical protein